MVCDKDDSIIKIYTYFIFYNGKPSHSDVLWEKNAIPCCPNMPVEIQMFGMIGVPKQLKYLYLSSHLIQSNVTPKQSTSMLMKFFKPFDIHILVCILVIILQNVFQLTTDNTYKRIGYSLGFERMCGYVMHVITC